MMEKTVIKTLLYADIFDYPMKAWEIHKWLFKEGSLREVERALKRLKNKNQVANNKGFYFLKKRSGNLRKRIERQKQSETYLRQAKFVSMLFKIIPWVKLVGVSGSLAMENAKITDDIDFFVITGINRIWLSRIFLLLILELCDKRRKRGESAKRAQGKICINMILEEDSLESGNKDIYTAHEVLQMKVLWQREGMYSKFLEENAWVFKFLPNWYSGERFKIQDSRFKNRKSKIINHKSFFDLMEDICKWIQIRYMGKPDGKERIMESALFFHPMDYREKVLKEFKAKLSSFT